MSTKFKDFLHRIAPDNGVRSARGRLAVDVSSNGTSTVVWSKELEDVLFERFDEMKGSVPPAPMDSD